MAKPVTNRALEELLIESGYQNAVLARQIVLLGRQRSLELRYDGASVYWWLRGRVPDEPAPSLLCEALSRRLGRTIIPEDLGFRLVQPTEGLIYAPDPDAARTAATQLWHTLAANPEADAPLAEAATIEAGWKWHFDPDDRDSSGQGRRRVTSADIARLREVAQSFVMLDRQFGGGHVSGHLLALLDREVTPLLRGSYSDRDGRAMFSIAAELTGQVGFSAYDAGRHGVAQRSFIQALRLSKAAGDVQLGTHILANMSTQAVGLGRVQEAVQLARAASMRTLDDAHPVVVARIHTAEATANALAKNPSAFRRSIQLSEQAVAQIDANAPPPTWAGYFTPAHWAGSAIRGLRDLGMVQEALKYETLALDLREASVRTRALHSSLLATVHAAAGNVDRSCELAHQALDIADGVRSERIVRRVATLQRQLQPHKDLPEVAELYQRLADRREH